MHGKQSCIKTYNRKSLKSISIAFITNLLAIVFSVIQATILSKIISLVKDKDTSKIVLNSVLLISIVIIYRFITYFLDVAKKKFLEISKQECRNITVDKFINQPLNKIYSINKSESKEKLDDDFRDVYNNLNTYIPNILSCCIAILVYGVLLSRVNIGLFLIIFLIALTQIIPPLFSKYFAEKFYTEDRENEEKIYECIISAYKGNSTLKLYNLYGWFKKRFSSVNNKAAKVGMRSVTAFQMDEAVSDLIRNVLNIATYMIVGFYVLHQYCELQEGVYAISLAGSLYLQISNVLKLIPDISVLKKATKRIDDWFMIETPKSYISTIKRISIKNVSKNQGDKPIFKNIGFDIDIDKNTLVCGENGSGKSTILKMIINLIDTTEGIILYDDIDINTILDDSILKNISYLNQFDPSLNMTPYKLYKSISETDLNNMLEIAKEFKLTNEEINNTNITDLSGGQKKKVYLSIVLANKDKYLVLDEPTNSMDIEGINTLIKLIQNRSGGCLIVTHDDKLKSIADKIISMETVGELI